MKDLNLLVKNAIDRLPRSRAALQAALRLDTENFDYYFEMLKKAMQPVSMRSRIFIFEEGKIPPAQATVVYPLSSAPKHLADTLSVLDYKSLLGAKDRYLKAAHQVTLECRSMHAGLGSSIDRISYLGKISGLPESQVKVGAKGTDLTFLVDGKEVSLADLKDAQLILDRTAYKNLILHDIVGPETQESIRARRGPHHSGETLQAYVPTLNENLEICFDRFAPAGHAFFAIKELCDVAFGQAPSEKRIVAISNGEDPGSNPSPVLVGAIFENGFAITLVTTEKTVADVKGGFPAVYELNGKSYVTVVETAQAQESGQLDLFIRTPGNVSTNQTLFNEDVLGPQIEKLLGDLKKDVLASAPNLTAADLKDEVKNLFLQIIAPDLIQNWKTQKDASGEKKKYLQVEGAMGSSIMNLDREYRRRYGRGLVQIINFPKELRDQAFIPIKSAFDWLAMRSRFKVNLVTMRLKDQRLGSPLLSSLTDPKTNDLFYQNVQNVIEVFSGVNLLELDSIRIEGQVLLRNAVLKSAVEIINRTGELFDLSDWIQTQPVLENIRVEISKDKKIFTSVLL